MNLYENIKSNLKNLNESETLGDLLEEIDNAYSIGEIESIGKRFKNELDRKTIEDEIGAIEEEYGDVYEMDEDSEEYASILDELKSCISSDFSGEEENLNESEENNLYIYSNAESEDKSDADSWADIYSKEAPNLKFKVHKSGDMYFVDFIGKKEDIIDYIKKLGWFNDDEIEEHCLIKPLNESAKLKESDYKIWSNHGQEEYYQNLSREEMIEEIKANGWDEEEINGEPILNADDEDLREYLTPYDLDLDFEDYENSILPMIEDQCYNDELVLTGTAANWRGKGAACKAIKTKDLQNYFFPNYDASIQLYCNGDDDLYYTEANHDTPMGGTEMYLYSFKDETAYNNAEKLLQKIYEDEDWDMYYFDDWAGYSDVEELIEKGLLTPVKRNPQYVGRVNESESLKEASFLLSPKYDSAQSFYGKARVDHDGDAYTLISYTTPIVRVENGKLEVLCDEDALSQTTMRHVREFLQQMEEDGKLDLSNKDPKLSTKRWLLSLRGE